MLRSVTSIQDPPGFWVLGFGFLPLGFYLMNFELTRSMLLCLSNLSSMPQDTSVEVKSECLDILSDLLHRFGNLMIADHEKLLSALLAQLNLQRAGLRKRAIQCLGTLFYVAGSEFTSVNSTGEHF